MTINKEEFNNVNTYIGTNKITFPKNIKSKFNNLTKLWNKSLLILNDLINMSNNIHPEIIKFMENKSDDIELKNLWNNYIIFVDKWILYGKNYEKVENNRKDFIKQFLEQNNMKSLCVKYIGQIDHLSFQQQQMEFYKSKLIGDEIAVEYHEFELIKSNIPVIFQWRLRDDNPIDILEEERKLNKGYTKNEIQIIKKKISSLRFVDSKKFSVKGNMELDDILKLLDKQDKKCYVCNENVLIEANDYCCYKFSIDRINDDDLHNSNNILISCYYCNCRNHKDFTQQHKICNSGCHTDKKDIPLKTDDMIIQAGIEFNDKYISDDNSE